MNMLKISYTNCLRNHDTNNLMIILHAKKNIFFHLRLDF